MRVTTRRIVARWWRDTRIMRVEQPEWGVPRATSADPERPVFYVTFWRRDPSDDDRPVEQRAYESQEWDVSEADIRQVLEWAADRAGTNGTYTVEVASPVIDGDAGRILVYGRNPVREAVDIPLISNDHPHETPDTYRPHGTDATRPGLNVVYSCPRS